MKKVNSRKRHIIVDSQGFLLMAFVTRAHVNDRTALEDMVPILKDQYPCVKKMWADMGYQGQALRERIKQTGIDFEVIKRPQRGFWVPQEVKDVTGWLKERGVDLSGGFKVLTRRWVVERTFAWMGRYRRLSKDYEFLCSTQETMMKLTMCRTMLKRTAKMAQI